MHMAWRTLERFDASSCLALAALCVVPLFTTEPATALALQPGDIITASFDVFPNEEGGDRGIVAIDAVTGAQSLVSVGSLTGGTGLLDSPQGIRVSPSGRIFLVDSGVNTGVRSLIVVDPESGSQEYVSTSGLLQDPVDLELENEETILILDRTSGFFRVDIGSGVQTPVFETGWSMCARGLALAGTIAFITSNGGGPCSIGRVLRVDLVGQSVEPLTTSPSWYGTSGVALTSEGRLYVSDFAEPRGIWEVDLVGDEDRPVAEVPGFGLASEASGSLVTTELGDRQVLRIHPATGEITIASAGGHLDPGFGIAVMPVPEPSWGLPLAIGIIGLARARRARRSALCP